MKYAIHVNLDAPAEIDPMDMAQYVATAVRCWSKSGHPDDPFWDIDNVTATCRNSRFVTGWSDDDQMIELTEETQCP